MVISNNNNNNNKTTIILILLLPIKLCSIVVVVVIKEAKIVWFLILFVFVDKYIIGTSFIHYSYFWLVINHIGWQ